MKKIVAGLVAIGALVGLVFLFPSLKQGNDTIYLYVESAGVSLKENETSSYIPISETKKIVKNGSFVSTNKTGLAHIVFPNNSVVSLGNNAELQLLYEDENVSISQLLGDTYHRVMKLGKEKTYEVKTPGTLAAVRGTKFAISYNNQTKKAKVAVTENTVAVSRQNASTTKPVDINVGSLAFVDETLPLSTKDIVRVSLTKNDPSLRGWLERNALLDTYITEDAHLFLETFTSTPGASDTLTGLRERLEKAKNATTKKETAGTPSKGSIKELIALGGSQKCEYSITENGVTSNATIYLSKGSMRIDSQTITKAKTQDTHMLLLDNVSYIWGDGMPSGIRMPIPDGTNTATKTDTPTNVSMVDLDKTLEYSCTSWKADSSFFTLPAGIKFMDMQEMINQAIPQTGVSGASNIQAMQCNACESLQEPEKSQCKQALGCR